MGDPRMSIHGWKQLAEWSIEYACLNETQKMEAKVTFHRDWEAFCHWVVETYSDYASGLKDLVHDTA